MSVAAIDAQIAQVHARIEQLKAQIARCEEQIQECQRQIRVQEGILEEQTKRKKGLEDMHESFLFVHNKFIKFLDDEMTRNALLTRHGPTVRVVKSQAESMQGFLKNGRAEREILSGRARLRKIVFEAELAQERIVKARREIERLEDEIRRLRTDIDRMAAEIQALEGQLGTLHAARAAAVAEEARRRAAAAAAANSSSKSSSRRR
ncbi:MAG: hypothetical protein LBR44_03190 [Clostridiales Family XIII bacterium]|jgi:predicted  nucleic acid-binding Zn-ribbon protein|nr:hypothetical protein [Clostridiales Family XIII bacterium]